MQNYSKQRVQRGLPGQLAGAGLCGSGGGGAGGGPTSAGAQRPGRVPCWSHVQPRLRLLLQEQKVSCPTSGISTAACTGHAASPPHRTAYRWSWSGAHSEARPPGARDAGRRTSEACCSLLLLPETHHPGSSLLGSPRETPGRWGPGLCLPECPPRGSAGCLRETPPTPPKWALTLPFLLRNKARTPGLSAVLWMWRGFLPLCVDQKKNTRR